MSSTNRGSQRSPADFYPTPAWCVARLLEAAALPGGHWMEPCAGDGSLIRSCNAYRSDIHWSAAELRPACRLDLEALIGDPGRVHIGDLLESEDWLRAQSPDVIITNPPFRLAREVMSVLVGNGATVVLLLRLNFLASAQRAPFMRRHPPDVYVLPNRPSFIGGGKTDSVEYAWFVWPGSSAARASGQLQVLAPTPVQERRSK